MTQAHTRYPVALTPDDNGTFLVTCPDIPEITTYGEGEQEALIQAEQAIIAMLSSYMDDRRDIPHPSSANGRPVVTLPAVTSAKILLYQSLREDGLNQAALADRLGWAPPQVSRLLDLLHQSRMDQLETAFRAIGRRMDLMVKEPA